MKIARLIAISCAFTCLLLTPALSENTCNPSMRGQTKTGVVWNSPRGACYTEWYVICRQNWRGFWYFLTQVPVPRAKGYTYPAQYQDRYLDSWDKQIPRTPDPCFATTPQHCVQICERGIPGCTFRARRG